MDDPNYHAQLQERLLAGKLAPAVECMLWHYAKGKPCPSSRRRCCSSRWSRLCAATVRDPQQLGRIEREFTRIVERIDVLKPA